MDLIMMRSAPYRVRAATKFMGHALLKVERMGRMTRRGVCLGCGKIFDAGYASGQAAEERLKVQFEKHECPLENGKRE